MEVKNFNHDIHSFPLGFPENSQGKDASIYEAENMVFKRKPRSVLGSG